MGAEAHLSSEADDEHESPPAVKGTRLEVVDDSLKYLPTLQEAYNPARAKRLIDRADQALKQLEGELELAGVKANLLPEIQSRLEDDLPSPETNLPTPEKLEEYIQRITEAYEAEEPYQEMHRLVQIEPYRTLGENNIDFDHFPALATSFRTREKIQSLFRKSHRENRKCRVIQAHEHARKIASSMIKALIYDVQKQQEQLKNTLSEQSGQELVDLYNSNSDTLEAKVQTLHSGIEQFKQLIALAKRIDALVEVFGKYKKVCGGEAEFAITSLTHDQEYLDRRRVNAKNIWTVEPYRIWSKLYDLAVHKLPREFNELYDEGNHCLGSEEHNDFHITQEFVEAMRRLNSFLKNLKDIVPDERVSNQIRDIHYPRWSVDKARQISAGRILTHTMPTKLMYEVLEKGELLSYQEQKKKGRPIQRTHSGNYDETRETHSICFETDNVYRNFSLDPHGIQHDAQIVLLFSDNQLLSDGKQFIDEMDGLHMFDSEFYGDNDDSPGLRIDLTKTPMMMMVSNNEKERFLTFLVEKSVWRDELAEMTTEEFDDWTARHVIFVESSARIKDVKKEFYNRQRISLNDGYVELSGKHSLMKVGATMPTIKFIPHSVQ